MKNLPLIKYGRKLFFFFTSYGKGVKPSNEIAMGPDSARCQVSSILVSSVNIKIFTILWKTLFCF